ncbi:MAG TPA: TIGR03560 family F420-dependent LLM class oxidoreductase [Thermomicrobiales bacterium]|nr:TIGR03560 family F420-dependent LLM class oxidoreductase [Thermomicrobiales bacterium]
MLKVSLMVEGQDGVTWTRWRELTEAAETLGFTGLYRSDHFTNPEGPVRPALELWASLTWLASHTERITFGPIVSPVSFRDPVVTAWQAVTVNDLSGGRLRLGLGAGWQEREHRSFGYDLLDLDGRFARFQEALEVISRLIRRDEPVTFDGDYYRLENASFAIGRDSAGAPPITIGGNGPTRTLPLVARYANEWNAVLTTAARFTELNGELDRLAREAGRQPAEIRRTMMTRVVLARDEAEARSKLNGRDPQELRDRGALVGDPETIIQDLGRLRDAGAAEVMLQWLDLDDMAGIEALASEVLPRL